MDEICGLYLEDVSDQVSSGNYYWRLVSAVFQDESESGFNHHIYYKCLDASGDPIENQKTWGSWWYTNETGSAYQYTKGAVDGYWANFAMYANCPGPVGNPCGWPYNAWVDETNGPSDKVWGMGMTNPDGTMCGAHVNFVLTWQWTQKSGGDDPEISVTPSSLNPTTEEGSSPSNQSFTVQNTGGGTLQYSISDNQSWLSVNPSSGSSTGESDTITVSYSTTSLSPGNYNATITVSDSNASNSPQTVSVALSVTSSQDPTISLSPTSLTPSVTEGSSPADQTFTVQNVGSGTLSYSISDNQSWLSVDPSSGTSTGEADTITVSYDTDSLSPDTYNATITVTDSNATNSPQTVSVTLTVNEASSFDGLSNGDMEDGSFNDPDGDHKSANDWHRFSLSGSSKAGVPWLGGSAHSANYVQEIYEAEWIAGIYQQVSGATSDNEYEASVYVWGSNSNVKFWIGIDPDGGTDASDEGIVWSNESSPGSTWTQISTSTDANGSTITVFLKAQNAQGYNLYARFDDADVVDNGGGGGPTTGTISGTVTDSSTSNGISGATVETDTGGYSATTDGNGNYTISDVAPGTYDVTAMKSGYEADTATGKSVTAGNTTDVDFSLDPTVTTGSITGTVKDESNDPISGATVETDTGGYSTTTNANGQYTLSEVDEGTYDVTASKSGYISNEQTGISVTAGQATVLNFTLSEAASFDGETNGDMEGGSFNDPDADHKTPNDWTRFTIDGSPKTGVPWLGSNAHSTNYCYEVYESDWIAGIYQNISGAEEDQTYTASVWVRGDDNVKFWIGVDPDGGTSPTSGNVEWSSYSQPGQTWTQISKQVTAGSNGSITVFIKAENTVQYNQYARIDDVDVVTP